MRYIDSAEVILFKELYTNVKNLNYSNTVKSRFNGLMRKCNCPLSENVRYSKKHGFYLV